MKKEEKILNEAENLDSSVTDIDIKYLIPNVIDNYMITILNGHHTIVLPPNTSGPQFKCWYRNKGGIFSKDVLNYSLKKPYGKYILIKNDDLNCIARIIDDEEELEFSSMKLIDGKIKDKSYMILRNIENGKKISSIQRYINENDMENDDSYVSMIIKKTIQEDDEEELNHRSGSISLFDE